MDELVAQGLVGQGPTTREIQQRRPRSRCPVCGRTWWAGLQKRAGAKYCSRRCRTAAWRERQGVVPKWLADLRAQASQ
ncbi:hypothetical protein [Nonomuraea aridisoli]|uniref:hypothetical protein n=1 Tax=Nonomuraea aridisoli TaxID=2070368 RepID=UPI0011B936D5|nr:hypothetical protein [Nonomuraea aridisoli]